MDSSEKLHEMIISDLRELKKDVKSLLSLKYQIFAMSSAVSFIVAIGWQLLIK